MTDNNTAPQRKDGDVIAVHATSTEATYPNAVNGPWITTVEEYHYKGVSGEGTRYRVVARVADEETRYPKHLGMICDSLDKALEMLRSQEQRVRESGVTAETPRTGDCAHCKSVVSPERYLLWTNEPFHQTDDNYDGCRGWD